ncbi:MAG: septum formation initiator family protein, partial [Candidatus Liptonbacteria bacterium]|nr:septum formation initiator family protein [Candidatus Liptonbacteria bacterium]
MYTRDFQERKKFEHFFYSWWTVLATAGLLIVVLSGITGLWRKERALKAEIADLDAKTTEIRAAREKNAQKLQALNTEEGVEEEARGKFNLKKEGEELVVFLDEKNAAKEK